MTETVIQRIRKRKTYQMFADIQQMLHKSNVDTRSQTEILFKIWDSLDSRSSWNSMRNAGFALESIDQLCRDAELVDLETVMREISEFKMKIWKPLFEELNGKLSE